jgi:hypothetical protein
MNYYPIHLYLLNIPIHQLQATKIMTHIIFLKHHFSYEQVIQLFEFKIFFQRI